MFRSTGLRAILASVAVIAIVAGCSSGATASPTGASATPGATVAAPTATAAPVATGAPATPAPSEAAAAYEVGVVTDNLGPHITGEDGKTLYLRTSDPAGGSSCTGGCAGTWPPFTLDAGETVTAGAGVTGTLTTFARADGSMQVAINGHALYYYAGDSAAGQSNGEGIGGVWFVVEPSGAKM